MKVVHLFLKRAHTHDRLCAVADGVYAIALTLLVLDLKVPEVPGISNPELHADLLQQVPNFIAYIIGFLVVAFFWMNHHRLFQAVSLCDEWALLLNLVHLLFISLTPYSASLIGHYEGDRIAFVVFSANLGVASLSLTVLGWYVLAKEEWRTHASNGTWVKIPLWAVFFGPGIAIVSIMISSVSINIALLLWLLLPLVSMYLLSKRSQDSLESQRPAEKEWGV